MPLGQLHVPLSFMTCPFGQVVGQLLSLWQFGCGGHESVAEHGGFGHESVTEHGGFGHESVTEQGGFGQELLL